MCECGVSACFILYLFIYFTNLNFFCYTSKKKKKKQKTHNFVRLNYLLQINRF